MTFDRSWNLTYKFTMRENKEEYENQLMKYVLILSYPWLNSLSNVNRKDSNILRKVRITFVMCSYH
jgi:hypothetical protein